MYTIVAQKATHCFRKYKKPDKRSENNIQYTVCLIIPSIPPIIDENGIKYRFSIAYMGRKMYSNSLYYIKEQNKYMSYKNRGKRSEKLAN